ncbi:lipoprotein, partial [Cutibacterium acnes]
MRKAIVTPVAVLAVLVMALTGCGQKNQSGGSKQSGVTSES